MSTEFSITGKRHSFGRTRGFPNGIWYGAVDGWECTAPVWNEEMAIQHARGQLENGGLVAALKTSIGCMEGWIKCGHSVEDAKARIERDTKLLNKIQQYITRPSGI